MPGSPQTHCLVYAGASEDGSRAFLAGRPEGADFYTYSLYEWSEEGGVQPVSILPGGEAAPATNGPPSGRGGSRQFSGAEGCQVTRSILRHAISADGSRAFWTYVPKESEAKPSQLLVRSTGPKPISWTKNETAAAAKGKASSGRANAEGSIVYFTDTTKLIAGAKAASRQTRPLPL